MTTGAEGGDGRRRRGPFDPLEMLDDVQRQAFQAAMRVAGELTAMGDLPGARWFGAPSGSRSQNGPTAAGDAGPPVDVGRLRGDVVRAAEMFSELMRALLDAGFDAMDELARRPPARARGSVAPGVVAELRCAIHNGDREPARRVRPHVRQLVSDGGGMLAAVVTVRPEQFDLEPYERAEVTVEVAVPADAEPGRYHGLLLAEGLADVASAITVEVAGGPAEPGDGD